MRCVTLAMVLCAVFVLPSKAPAQQTKTKRAGTMPAEAVSRITPEMTRIFTQLRPRLQPGVGAWVDQQGHAQAQKPTDVPSLESAIRARFGAVNRLSQNDVYALAFLVLMQAASETDNDLRPMMAQVKSMNAAKDALSQLTNKVSTELATNHSKPNVPCVTQFCRSLPAQLNQLTAKTSHLRKPVRLQFPANGTAADLQAVLGQLQNEKDSMSDLNQQDMFLLQTMMDKKSQLEEMISNVMNGADSAIFGLVQNLKAS